jgi:tetratricopeptide (TPR) repeat protein
LSGDKTPRPRLSLALCIGRLGENLTQKELAERSGTPDKEISALETRRSPGLEQMEELFGAMDRGPEEVETAVFCADLLLRPEASAESPVEPTLAEARTLRAAASLEAREVYHVTLEQFVQALREEKARIARQEAEALWQELKRRTPAERWRLVEEHEAWRTWALAERLALASEARAADDADAALDLARLAVRVAELTSGGDGWRSRVAGFCWGFLGNAHRVKGDFPAAEEAFLRSDRLWQAGAAADPGLILDGTRLLDLKASFRRSQGLYDESFQLLEEALPRCRTRHAEGRILLKMAVTLEQKGDWLKAIEMLEKASSRIDPRKEPRLLCIVRFSTGVNLCNASRHGEAEELLPEVRRLALQLGNNLDLLRVRWLDALISAGLGRVEKAVTDLEYVSGELISLGIAFDAARACLDLAQLYLRQGRTAEVKRLAGQVVEVFKAQRVPEPALAAVILFREAAERERATVELARKLSTYLRRAEGNPALHFEP